MLNERLISGSKISADSYWPGPGVGATPEKTPRGPSNRPSLVPKHIAVVCCLRKPSCGCLGAYWPGPGPVGIFMPPPISPAGNRSTVERNVRFCLAEAAPMCTWVPSHELSVRG